MKSDEFKYIRFIYRVQILKKFRISAIVLYPFVLFAEPKEFVTTALFRHELEHVYQINREGWFKFYTRYLIAYLKLRNSGYGHQDSYRRIPYEIAAREVESIPLTIDESRMWQGSDGKQRMISKV